MQQRDPFAWAIVTGKQILLYLTLSSIGVVNLYAFSYELLYFSIEVETISYPKGVPFQAT